MTYSHDVVTKTVTIADGQSLSGAAFLENFELCGVIIPSTWTTQAITFQGSTDNSTFYNIFNGASELSYAAIAASSWVAFDPALFLGIPYIKIRSGTAGTPANQAGGDVVTLVMRRVI